VYRGLRSGRRIAYNIDVWTALKLPAFAHRYQSTFDLLQWAVGCRKRRRGLFVRKTEVAIATYRVELVCVVVAYRYGLLLRHYNSSLVVRMGRCAAVSTPVYT